MKDRLELELREGTPVIVRPLLEEDRALVAEAYRRLSPEARYQRFWTRTGEMLGDAMLDRLVKQNPAQHMTWAVLDPARKFPGVGGASWWRNAAIPEEAEISAMVLDADQRRGIGTLLLQELIRRARTLGVHAIIAAIEAEQPASLALHARFQFEPVGHLRQVGFKFGRWLDLIYLELLLNPDSEPVRDEPSPSLAAG